ncbi:MAG TPA: hypothetical protein VGB05_02670, partial [Pyrinomonadaceae bacterium]
RWRDAVNKRGSNVTLVRLPEIGSRGNTHFSMSDLNNVEIADLLSKFLQGEGFGLTGLALLERVNSRLESLPGFQHRKTSGIIRGTRQ